MARELLRLHLRDEHPWSESMNAFKILPVAMAVLAAAIVTSAPAEAVPITGTATIIGFDSIDGSNLTNNTQFTFTGTPSVAAFGTGDLAAFVTGASATMNVPIWTFTGPFVPHSPFFTLSNGADSVVFDLDTSVSIQSRSGNDLNSTATLFLLGHLVPSGPGFAGIDPNVSSVSYGATAAFDNGGYSISLAAVAGTTKEVPEPATLGLLGGACLAAGALGRRKKKNKELT
jgi:PEP-CTERM motif-containing protein